MKSRLRQRSIQSAYVGRVVLLSIILTTVSSPLLHRACLLMINPGYEAVAFKAKLGPFFEQVLGGFCVC